MSYTNPQQNSVIQDYTAFSKSFENSMAKFIGIIEQAAEKKRLVETNNAKNKVGYIQDSEKQVNQVKTINKEERDLFYNMYSAPTSEKGFFDEENADARREIISTISLNKNLYNTFKDQADDSNTLYSPNDRLLIQKYKAGKAKLKSDKYELYLEDDEGKKHNLGTLVNRLNTSSTRYNDRDFFDQSANRVLLSAQREIDSRIAAGEITDENKEEAVKSIISNNISLYGNVVDERMKAYFALDMKPEERAYNGSDLLDLGLDYENLPAEKINIEDIKVFDQARAFSIETKMSDLIRKNIVVDIPKQEIAVEKELYDKNYLQSNVNDTFSNLISAVYSGTGQEGAYDPLKGTFNYQVLDEASGQSIIKTVDFKNEPTRAQVAFGEIFDNVYAKNYPPTERYNARRDYIKLSMDKIKEDVDTANAKLQQQQQSAQQKQSQKETVNADKNIIDALQNSGLQVNQKNADELISIIKSGSKTGSIQEIANALKQEKDQQVEKQNQVPGSFKDSKGSLVKFNMNSSASTTSNLTEVQKRFFEKHNIPKTLENKQIFVNYYKTGGKVGDLSILDKRDDLANVVNREFSS
jgi:hypothetical protein